MGFFESFLSIWVMIFSMMVQIDWSAMKHVGQKPQGLLLTLVVNWLIKPFTMAALGVLFFQYIFAPWVDPKSASEYIAGMILLGVAPCTAMVFVWSQWVKGDANYTLVQVSVNDLIMVLAFAPIAAFLLGVTDVTVSWQTLILSVVLYVALALMAGLAARRGWLRHGHAHLQQRLSQLKPWSVAGLISTVVLLLGLNSGAALATVVGVLVEVPVMLSLVAWLNARGAAATPSGHRGH